MRNGFPEKCRGGMLCENSNSIFPQALRFRQRTRTARRSVRGSTSEMQGDLEGNRRFLAFQDGEQRARNTKLEDLQRKLKSIKARVDAIDGKCQGDFQSFESLDSISRRITELGSLQRDFRSVERKLRWSAGLFCGSVALWLVTFLSS